MNLVVSNKINQKVIIALLVFFVLLSIFNLGLFLNSSTENSLTGNAVKSSYSSPTQGTASILIIDPPESEVTSNEN